MSRRVTVSLPDEVAERLEKLPSSQVSAYVAEALRRRQASDEIRTALQLAGNTREYAYDPEGAARRLSEGRVPTDVRNTAVAALAAELGRPVDEVRTELAQ
ncbi:hypothetical protein HC028_26200 [Planosporangium flavigriseum]|uniref:Uncharacterized protein n=1 Tax=Planosporangium flavigriseum TaxID=373681 RepID=A0A8J3LZJ2_9ACTN|nr:hypothetical protein [Planosporangium flavigriseum]NJC67971.1 hypothetical protein [Planosporangium flavigriseum]GIG76629.1 hypothetical protein Pfl04_50330 [Planosporangium flavigriseum]